jgi:hypothetical protein
MGMEIARERCRELAVTRMAMASLTILPAEVATCGSHYLLIV